MGNSKTIFYVLGIFFLFFITYQATNSTLFGKEIIDKNIGNWIYDGNLSGSLLDMDCIKSDSLLVADADEICDVFKVYYKNPSDPSTKISISIVKSQRIHGEEFYEQFVSKIQTREIVLREREGQGYLFHGTNEINSYYWHGYNYYVTMTSPMPNSYNLEVLSAYIKKYPSQIGT